MSDKLNDLSIELSEVDTAIRSAPLYADPHDAQSGFSDAFIDLAAREDQVLGQLIDQARRELDS